MRDSTCDRGAERIETCKHSNFELSVAHPGPEREGSSDRVPPDPHTGGAAGASAETGEVVCPHTAVGIRVADDHRRAGVPMITLATAHPAKFPDAVEQAIGIRPPLPPHMARLFDLPARVTRVENDNQALKSLILERRTA